MNETRRILNYILDNVAKESVPVGILYDLETINQVAENLDSMIVQIRSAIDELDINATSGRTLIEDGLPKLIAMARKCKDNSK